MSEKPMPLTREQVIEMALEAGFDTDVRNSIDGTEVVDDMGLVITDKVLRLAAAIEQLKEQSK